MMTTILYPVMICKIYIQRAIKNGYVYVSIADIGKALDIKSSTLHTRAKKANIDLPLHDGKSFIRTDDLTKIVSLTDVDLYALESIDQGFDSLYNSLMGEINRLNKELKRRDEIITNIKALVREL